jgi:hypothetical protein
MTERFALVALPLPVATPYTYRIPETLGDRVVPGARLVVPVRRRELIGVAVAIPPRQRYGTSWPFPTSSLHCLRHCSKLPDGSGAITERPLVLRSNRSCRPECGVSRRW